jgi:pumilio family protein 6
LGSACSLVCDCPVLLQSKLDDWVTNKHAARVLLQLLVPDSHRYLPPATYELLHPPAKSMMVSAAAAAAGGSGAAAADIDDDEEMLDDDQADEQQQEEADEGEKAGDADEAAGASSSSQLVERQVGESRKDPVQRRRELLSAGGKDSLAAVLLALCAEQAGELLCSQVAADIVVEVARGAADGLLWELQQQGVEAVHAAVVQQVAADCSRVSSQPAPAAAGKKQKGKKGKGADAAEQDAADAEQQQEPLLTQYFASRALRRLLLAGGSEGADGAGARAFAQQLWQQALQGQCKQLVGSHAEKVLAGLLHCGVQEAQQQAAAELQPLVGDVEAWAAKFWGPAGGQEQQHHSKTKEKKKAKARAEQRQEQQQQQNGTPAQSAKKKKKR